jgi:RimJ/RimL family protein N-acetyltransferase
MPSPISLAVKPTLTGDMVVLRPVTVEDVDLIPADDAEAMRLTGSHPRPEPLSREFMREWYATRADHDDRLDLAVVDRVTGRFAGEVVLNELNPDDESCSFRILLCGDANRDCGLGTEATRLILRHAFENVGLHRVELEVYDFNPEPSAFTKRSASCSRALAGTRCCGMASGSTRTRWPSWRLSGRSIMAIRRSSLLGTSLSRAWDGQAFNPAFAVPAQDCRRALDGDDAATTRPQTLQDAG